MPTTLLRPALLSYKNRLRSCTKNSLCNRETAVIALSIGLVVAIYFATYTVMLRLKASPEFSDGLVTKMIGLWFLGFFALLFPSNCVIAFGRLYSSRDLMLLLIAPVANSKLFYARLVEVILLSGWVFLLFCPPFFLGIAHALAFEPSFISGAVLVSIPLLIIPAALAIILVTLFVNVFPAEKIRDFLALCAFLLVFGILFGSQSEQVSSLQAGAGKPKSFIALLLHAPDPRFDFLPTTWATEVLCNSVLRNDSFPTESLTLLLSAAAVLVAIAYLVFDSLFLRGYAMTISYSKVQRIRYMGFASQIGRFLVPFNSQLRGLLFKEVRMFVRDTSQSLQLLLLLLLTFVYLYNFRSLQEVSTLNEPVQEWWRAILCISNVMLGTCVVSAIATRFVFPAVSLEGPSYSLLRTAPLSIASFLRNKFFIWLVPIAILSVILIVSGAWAIKVPPETVIVCAILALSLSVGIVGLGIGIGAVYVRFDWDAPTDVAASFGSLVYMMLSLAIIFVSFIPASFLIVVTCVPSLSEELHRTDYTVAMSCAYFLVFFANAAAAKHALDAGALNLQSLES